MRKNVLLPALTLAAGVVGFVLRRWQLATGFEAGTGLPISGVPATAALMGFSAVVAVALLALCWRERERMPYGRAFAGAEGNTLYMTAMVVAGILLVASAGMEALSYPEAIRAAQEGDTWTGRMAGMLLPPLRVLFCLGGCPCILLWSRPLYRGERDRGAESLPLLELSLLFCVWLISDYQIRAADPVIQDYLYEIFAIAGSLLGLYFLAGYSFLKEGGRPRRTLLLCLLGSYFSLVTLADRHGMADILRCGFSVLFLTSHAALILSEHPAGEEIPAETECKENG